MDLCEFLAPLTKSQLHTIAYFDLAHWEARERWRKARLIDLCCSASFEELIAAVNRDQLREMAQAHGLPASGRRAELEERLRGFFNEGSSLADFDFGIWLCGILNILSKRDLLRIGQRLADPDIRTRWTKDRIIQELEVYDSETLLDAITVLQIRALLGYFDVATSGTKSALVDRLKHTALQSFVEAEKDADADAATEMPAESVVPQAVPVAAMSHRVKALLWGNSNYSGSDELSNPTRDAEAIAEVLEHLGHEVLLRLNRTKGQMIRDVQALARSVRPTDGVLVYFSGHGLELFGENWLIPVGFNATEEGEIEYEAFPANRALKTLRRAKFRVLVLDACRANSFKALARGSGPGRGLRAMTPEGTQGVLISFATAPGQLASDGLPGQNSPFAGALSKHLPTPGLTIESILKEVRRTVQEATGGEQVPWENSSLTGDWYPAG